MTTRLGAPVGISGTIIRHWMLFVTTGQVFTIWSSKVGDIIALGLPLLLDIETEGNHIL